MQRDHNRVELIDFLPTWRTHERIMNAEQDIDQRETPPSSITIPRSLREPERRPTELYQPIVRHVFPPPSFNFRPNYTVQGQGYQSRIPSPPPSTAPRYRVFLPTERKYTPFSMPRHAKRLIFYCPETMLIELTLNFRASRIRLKPGISKFCFCAFYNPERQRWHPTYIEYANNHLHCKYLGPKKYKIIVQIIDKKYETALIHFEEQKNVTSLQDLAIISFLKLNKLAPGKEFKRSLIKPIRDLLNTATLFDCRLSCFTMDPRRDESVLKEERTCEEDKGGEALPRKKKCVLETDDDYEIGFSYRTRYL